ncbi:MAG: SpaH/EbpB family LPXTG-anchored major pilin [Clostridia bacterium]|nr:SpaH/EbpB family LPXTG-anchored major pilin [Clostridia bacterium]
MKKVFAVLVALTLVLSCAVMAFAAETPAVATGTITITNAIVNSTYNVYKMLDFEPSAADPSKGIYTIADGWENFFKTGIGKDYFDIVANGDEENVVLKANKDIDQTLATAAVAYAKDEANSISPAKAEQKATSDTVTFTGLDLGYYAVDTTVGTLCSLTGTDSNVTAIEKNRQPDITKEVQEDRDNSWGAWNDVKIGQEVNYSSTITVGYGAINYIMHDTMDAALTFDPDSVKATVNGTEYTADDGKFQVVTTTDDTCTFEVVFTNDFIKEIEKKDQDVKIVVTYSAVLNENAVVEVAHLNTVYLSYGDENEWETDKHTTKTYTWKFDVFKYTEIEENGATTELPLEGAKFELHNANNELVKFTEVTGADVLTYRVDPNGEVKSFATPESGEIYFIGLDEGTYSLVELEAPAGYNKLSDPVAVTISSEKANSGDITYTVNNAADQTVKVLNNTGSLLPETGGIGTTIFYVVGGLLMVCALVVLVSKKRMASFA